MGAENWATGSDWDVTHMSADSFGTTGTRQICTRKREPGSGYHKDNIQARFLSDISPVSYWPGVSHLLAQSLDRATRVTE